MGVWFHLWSFLSSPSFVQIIEIIQSVVSHYHWIFSHRVIHFVFLFNISHNINVVCISFWGKLEGMFTILFLPGTAMHSVGFRILVQFPLLSSLFHPERELFLISSSHWYWWKPSHLYFVAWHLFCTASRLVLWLELNCIYI